MGARRNGSATRRRQDDAETRKSLAFYFGLLLLAGQFVARVALGIPFDLLFLSITAALVLGVLFGPSFVIEFFKVIRSGSGGSERESGQRDLKKDDDGG